MKANIKTSIKTCKHYLIKLYRALLVFICTLCILPVLAEEAAEETKTQQSVSSVKQDRVNRKATKTPYVIETLVQGSQEQPNVIYITPWQENEKAVRIQGQSLHVSLPQLAPVNPKNFKKQLNNHYQKQTINRD